MTTPRKQRIKKSAGNFFSKNTGIEAVQLTGASSCLVTKQKCIDGVPVRKVAYVMYEPNGWQAFEMGRTSKRMKGLRVKQTCKVDQCVNPEHLIGNEVEEGDTDTGGWGA